MHHLFASPLAPRSAARALRSALSRRRISSISSFVVNKAKANVVSEFTASSVLIPNVDGENWLLDRCDNRLRHKRLAGTTHVVAVFPTRHPLHKCMLVVNAWSAWRVGSAESVSFDAFPGANTSDPFALVKDDIKGLVGSVKELLGVDHPVLSTVAKYAYR